MSKSNIKLLAVIALLVPSICLSENTDSKLKTVEKFYTKYFNYNYHKTPNIPAPTIQFSAAFNKAIKANKDLCAKYADGPCGFGGDGDPYTDSQDSDDNLSAEKVKLQVTELKDGLIQVRFNLFPAEGNSFTTVKYKLIKEGNAWMVDDIIYSHGKSARFLLKEENDYNLEFGPENIKQRELLKK
jgi:hypothetical protein